MKVDGMDANITNIQKTVTQNKAVTSKIQTQGMEVSKKNASASLEALAGKKIGDISEYQKSELSISEKVVIEAIEKANKAISGANREFQFSIHGETKQILIKVLDKNTKEVVQEFPSEKVLDMIAKICEKSGLIFDERR